MKKRFKLIIIMCLSLVVIISGVSIYASYNIKDSYSVGKQIKAIDEVNDTSVIAKVNDVEITKKDFNNCKALWSIGDNVPKDPDLLDKMIERKILYTTATKEGISVSDEELNKAVQEQKSLYASNEEAKTFLSNLIKGLDITEDQYWDRMQEGIKQALIVGKYKSKLLESYKEQNPNIPSNEIRSKFTKYYENAVSDLKKNAKIERFDK